uniref:Uncharacterized protein n=1 Tax=Oryza barthii TaxID=65489 RepID=A0A0D3H7T8_9ORYZ
MEMSPLFTLPATLGPARNRSVPGDGGDADTGRRTTPAGDARADNGKDELTGGAMAPMSRCTAVNFVVTAPTTGSRMVPEMATGKIMDVFVPKYNY